MPNSLFPQRDQTEKFELLMQGQKQMIDFLAKSNLRKRESEIRYYTTNLFLLFFETIPDIYSIPIPLFPLSSIQSILSILNIQVLMIGGAPKYLNPLHLPTHQKQKAILPGLQERDQRELKYKRSNSE